MYQHDEPPAYQKSVAKLTGIQPSTPDQHSQPNAGKSSERLFGEGGEQ